MTHRFNFDTTKRPKDWWNISAMELLCTATSRWIIRRTFLSTVQTFTGITPFDTLDQFCTHWTNLKCLYRPCYWKLSLRLNKALGSTYLSKTTSNSLNSFLLARFITWHAAFFRLLKKDSPTAITRKSLLL